MQDLIQVKNLATSIIMIALLSQLLKTGLTRERFSINPRPKARCRCLDVIAEILVYFKKRFHQTGVLAELGDTFDVRGEFHRERHNFRQDLTAGVSEVSRGHGSKFILDFTQLDSNFVLDKREPM